MTKVIVNKMEIDFDKLALNPMILMKILQQHLPLLPLIYHITHLPIYNSNLPL